MLFRPVLTMLLIRVFRTVAFLEEDAEDENEPRSVSSRALYQCGICSRQKLAQSNAPPQCRGTILHRHKATTMDIIE
jgi:hypothetical protein